MDVQLQLKNNLISRIQNSKDLNFLKALQTIFDTSEQALYDLNSTQSSAIEKSRLAIKNGEFLTNEDVFSNLEKWMEKQ